MIRRLMGVGLAAALLAAGAASAQTETCAEEKVHVFFGNGVLTSRAGAAASLVELRAAVEPGLAEAFRDKVEFDLSYNNTLLLLDFVESIDQWSDEMDIHFLRWIRGLDDAPAWFRSALDVFIRSVDAQQFVLDGDLRRHVQRYRELVEQGHKVLVVSHSQGNFYANAAHRLVDSEGFGITAVATPAGLVEGGGPYTTLVGDRVIAIVPGSLPANVTNPARGDWLNHGFVESYMAGAPSRGRIVGLVHQVMAALPYPEREVEGGIITVRLTWGAQPDVDLHVFEPGGAHVYYADPRGSAGYLDVDDVTGFGPEHYYVSCDSLQEGTYQVGVNYYRGSAPETAQIQVSAGAVVRNYSRGLPAQRGSGGDGSPVPVATITVTRNDDDELEFQVTEAAGADAAPAPQNRVPAPKPPFIRTALRE